MIFTISLIVCLITGIIANQLEDMPHIDGRWRRYLYRIAQISLVIALILLAGECGTGQPNPEPDFDPQV